MPTLDLVIQENHGQFNFTSPVLPPERFDLADDIYVGKIDSEAVKLLLGFGYHTGYNVVTDWLIEEEMMEVRALFHHMAAVTLPFRLSRAFWYHEYAARTYYGEVRWVLVCTALESGSVRQPCASFPPALRRALRAPGLSTPGQSTRRARSLHG